MKKRIKQFFLFFGIFSLSIWGGFHLFFWIDTQEEKRLVIKNIEFPRLSTKEVEKLQEGDIILRRGYGFFSDIIADKLNGDSYDVTHSGILYRKDNQWWVIHSLSSNVSPIEGVQTQSLQMFLKYSIPGKILIVRLNKITPSQGREIIKRAQYYLQKKVSFDHLGIIDDPSELYCSELIYQIIDNDLHFVNFPTEKKARKETFYSMKTLYNPQYFKIIINTYPKKKERP
ncbi:YiiX/YebB-like N1pC/P60 family cysteine hydrolase [Capnocytophaga sp. oral taxon 338]|uniref:YiiX/YebB-like N1pC/P60 family cysteine hydrolase n=1 Tax=Capnocytophaga sp. oral taxon 338 TaxID=710239 RepID=UPI000202FB9F|nr:YiiX/YebB-like N1pC/P60 family cysteine hydrolase [Capnocytophaga sp. oral taxon 338]EGD33705.1 hypothetical protein HMPREF9071_1867 [Capnocytophaga sp. oral taxon 338 str. F0234]